MTADGAPLSTADLLEAVWDCDTDPESTTVKVTVHQLRRKLGPPPLIETVPGFGYRL